MFVDDALLCSPISPGFGPRHVSADANDGVGVTRQRQLVTSSDGCAERFSSPFLVSVNHKRFPSGVFLPCFSRCAGTSTLVSAAAHETVTQSRHKT